jgi:hypothetical protein
MGKFSKNGKPLGRVSANANKHKAWTAEEDNYLALAISENKSLAEVAARLGRTKNGVSFRKHKLGLDGKFTKSKRGRKPGWKKATAPTEASITPSGMSIMILERGIPVPARGSKTHESERIKLRELFKIMEVGMSFVVPRNLVHVAKHITTKEFEAYRIKTSATSADKKFFRIFRVA